MYKIELSKQARKSYLKLPETVRLDIHEKLKKLSESPYSHYFDVKKLHGIPNNYRLRVGDWRILYRIYNHALIIEVIKIGLRKEVYR
jgi:mRNA interferase RelE/StbE